MTSWLDWLIQHGLTSPPTHYRLSGRRFYRSKDPTNSIKVYWRQKCYKKKNEKANNTKYSNTIKRHTYKKHSKSLVYTSTMGLLGDSSQRAGSPSLNGSGAAAVVPTSWLDSVPVNLKQHGNSLQMYQGQNRLQVHSMNGNNSLWRNFTHGLVTDKTLSVWSWK